MTLIRTLSVRLPAIDPRSIGDIEQEIVDELDFHVAMRTQENTRRGMPLDAARDAALSQFGDFATIHQKCRRTLLGARIMWQRIQMVISIVLLAAVALLAAQLYSGQRANQAALADITSTLKQLTQPPANSESPSARLSSSRSVPNNWSADRPTVVETIPKNGDTSVDPAIGEIRATFSKPMADGSWSWVQTSKDSFPESTGDVHYLDDGKTCVMPCKLERGKQYIIWFNSANYHNFKDSEGRPAEPYLLRFTTKE
jgi:Bacterial Ig-like domain